MSSIKKDFNDESLFETLHKAIEDDKLYWIRNEAKIRASYTSQNYDEFKETVAAAHLCPLSKEDKAKKCSGWNTMVRRENKEE